MVSELDDEYPILVGARLKSERYKIGLATQADAAKACGVSREMWGQYERGKTLPGVEALARFALLGGDVQHVLTGSISINSANQSPVSPISQGKRIAWLRGGLPTESYAKMLEVEVSELEACEAGTKPARASLLLSICRLTNANLDWLLRGVGKPHADEYDELFLSFVSSLGQQMKKLSTDQGTDDVIRTLEKQLLEAEKELRALTKENANLQIAQAKFELEKERLVNRIAEFEKNFEHTYQATQNFNQSQIANVAGRDVRNEAKRGKK